MAKKINKTLKVDIKLIALPAGSLLVSLVLLAVGFSVGFAKVNEQLQNLEESRQTEKVLEEKLSLLESLPITALARVDSLVLYMPADDPGAWATSYFKSLAEADSHLISGTQLKLGGIKDDSIQFSELVVDVESENFSSLVRLLKGLKQSVPIRNIKEIDLRVDSNGTSRAEVTTTFYWSAFPAMLGSVSDPVSSLTEAEEKLLGVISVYKTPEFSITNTLTPSEPSERENPFN